MDKHSENDSRLLRIAGFNLDAWDAAMVAWVAKELRGATPAWAIRLCERTGWRWPLSLAGVVAAQEHAGQPWQVVSVTGPTSSIRIKGLVSH